MIPELAAPAMKRSDMNMMMCCEKANAIPARNIITILMFITFLRPCLQKPRILMKKTMTVCFE